VIAGFGITISGRYIPFLIIGTILSAVGTGLFYTFDVDTPAAKWIAYQLLSGLGLGLTNQIPIVAGQGAVEASDVAIVTALMMFFQTFTGAIFSAAAQSIYTNKTVKVLPKYVPGIDPNAVIAVGATNFRTAFPLDVVPGIIASYMEGLRDVFLIGLGAALASFAVAVIIAVFDRRRLNTGTRTVAPIA
jgi:hypothetical protein